MLKRAPRDVLGGYLLLEVVVSLAVVVLILGTFTLATSQVIRFSKDTSNQVQASFLLEEGIEAMRFVRDSGWDDNIDPLAAETTYYLYFDGSSWRVTTTPESVFQRFDRYVYLDEVYRDSNDDIVASGGALDPDTKEVNVVVSWLDASGITHSVAAASYLTNQYE